MKVLAIETATAVCAVAIVEEGRILAERHLEAQYVHSEKLMTFIDECLTSSRTGLQAIEGFAVSIGPGSFTGLRIGLSVAKGLAYATGKPVVGIPTLEALALQAVRSELVQEDEYIVPMIDARRDEIYAARYRRMGNTIIEAVASQAYQLKGVLALMSMENSTVLMGDGVNKFQQYLVQAESMDVSHIIIPIASMRACSAVAVGVLGEQKLLKGEGTDGVSLEPLYVKEFYTTATLPQSTVIS